MMNQRTMPAILIAAFLFLGACTPENRKLSDNKNEIIKENPDGIPQVPPAETPPTTPPSSPGQDSDLKLCSKLDLAGVSWPTELTQAEWTYYALSLNITGSFEGRQGWKNITGNFDGQGMSLGLMQQNFGQGTLQPWLIEMYNQHNGTMVTHFNAQDYRNLKSMLDDWRKSSVSSFLFEQEDREEELFPTHGVVSKLDVDYVESDLVEVASDSSKSVQWARNNILDSRGDVTSRWKKSFQDMAISPEYRSFQLAASTKIFAKAKQYFIALNFHELRFLLFFFDIVVQNGSIKEEHLVKYNKWLKSNPNATEQARALALLEARLTTVRPQYVSDVRSRKSTIIHGTGTVHQTPRNLTQEYCFDPRVIVQ